MNEQIPLSEMSIADLAQQHDDGTSEVLPDLAYKRLAMVNVVFFGFPNAGDRQWILIDAGLPGTAGMIERAAKERFGESSRPAAIVLTHGHIDHVGALETLAEKWDAPIYAHEAELPYLNGQSAYPPPDSSVGGGIMPAMSLTFPRGPLDVSPRLRTLPADQSVPGMPGWIWLHTPGHTPGHVSFWRETDRTVIAGDAFITTNQESAYAVAVQKPEMHGPPKYFTPDWESARASVIKLAGLNMELAVTGHGRAMHGSEPREALNRLATNFVELAVPEKGRYVDHPATAEDGSAYLKP